MDRKVGIKGIGSYVPEKILTNFDLEKMVDTNDQWIRERTGIEQRRIAGETETTSDIATKAALAALEDANLKPEEVDMIISATVTPDQYFPSVSCLVQRNIGAKNAATFDLSAACAGTIYALTTAWQYILSGYYKNVLVIGADTLSKIVDWEDRNTCVLFGDGAGALVIGEVENGGIMSTVLGSDGEGADVLTCPATYIDPAEVERRKNNVHTVWMDGGEVYKFAVKIMPLALEQVIEKSGLTPDDIDWFVPHQANIRIIEAAAKRFDKPMDKFMKTIHKYGNTSSSSVIIALDEYKKAGKVKKGDKIAMVGFGAGLTWGSAVIQL